jgi:hypothetical protein
MDHRRNAHDALHALRTDTVLPQRFLVRIQARAAAVDRRHRERRGFEGDLLDAGVGHHVHAQARAQGLVFLVRDQMGETLVNIGHADDCGRRVHAAELDRVELFGGECFDRARERNTARGDRRSQRDSADLSRSNRARRLR